LLGPLFNHHMLFALAFSLKSVKLLFMTFSFYSYAWRFTYRNTRVREASV